jgi:DnaK suppressor protein
MPLDSRSKMTEEELRAAPESDYMSPAQLSFFRDRLMAMRDELRTRQAELRENLETADVPTDPADRATREEQEWLEMRLRERESTLLQKIDESLRRIHAKEYGYCTKSGEPIGISRLLARPTATTAVYT